MPTNEERREVARKLRESRGGWSSGECYYTIIRAIGLPDTSREDGGHALYSAIADLIEPEPERACHIVTTERKTSQTQTMVSKSCSCCGYVFGSEEHRPLLPGLDEEIVLDEVRIPNYCKYCGAKVVDE